MTPDLAPLATLRQVTRDEARQLSHLLCSACWRPIRATFKWNQATRKSEDFITCGTPDCPMHGFVSKRFVEQREQISYAELREAKHALRESIPALQPQPIGEAQALAEMGF